MLDRGSQKKYTLEFYIMLTLKDVYLIEKLYATKPQECTGPNNVLQVREKDEEKLVEAGILRAGWHGTQSQHGTNAQK